MRTFSTCIADPPWPYGKTGPKKKGEGFAGDQYETMSIEELWHLGDLIRPLEIDYLFLWVAKKFLFQTREGFDIMVSWGFTPKSALVWHKKTGSGVGSWFKSDVEFVLLGTREGSPFRRTCETDFFSSPRLGHSIKPDYIHELAERKFSGPFLELFGRRTRPNWTVLGNQAPDDGRDIRESLRDLTRDR